MFNNYERLFKMIYKNVCQNVFQVAVLFKSSSCFDDTVDDNWRLNLIYVVSKERKSQGYFLFSFSLGSRNIAFAVPAHLPTNLSTCSLLAIAFLPILWMFFFFVEFQPNPFLSWFPCVYIRTQPFSAFKGRDATYKSFLRVFFSSERNDVEGKPCVAICRCFQPITLSLLIKPATDENPSSLSSNLLSFSIFYSPAPSFQLCIHTCALHFARILFAK